MAAPPGLKTHAVPQQPHSLQPHNYDATQSQAAMPANRASAKYAVPAGSMAAHDAAPQAPAPRAAMSVPGEAAARQGSSAAKIRLQERLAANEEVCLDC